MTQGQLLKKIRYKNNLSQIALSKICGFTTAQFVSNIERGIAGIPMSMAKVLIKRKLVDRDDLKYAIVSDFKAQIEREL